MCCGTPTTLYGTTTQTTSYTTTMARTTTIPPHASYSYRTTTSCVSSSGSVCVSLTARTDTAIFDFFYPVTKTTSFTTVVPVITEKTVATATRSTPCPHKRDGDNFDNIEKRGAGSLQFNAGSKLGVIMVALVLCSTLIV